MERLTLALTTLPTSDQVGFGFRGEKALAVLAAAVIIGKTAETCYKAYTNKEVTKTAITAAKWIGSIATGAVAGRALAGVSTFDDIVAKALPLANIALGGKFAWKYIQQFNQFISSSSSVRED